MRANWSWNKFNDKKWWQDCKTEFLKYMYLLWFYEIYMEKNGLDDNIVDF